MEYGLGRSLRAALAGALLLALAGCATAGGGMGAAGAAKAPAFERVYVFGDSYSDTGYGLFYSDGPTAVAYMAEALGAPVTHTKAPDWQGKSLNFSVSGAQTGAGGGGGGLVKQATDFAALVSSRQVTFDPDKTLFFIAGGLNDRNLTTEQSEANLAWVVEMLRSTRARHFEVANMPEKIPAFSVVGTRLNPMLAALPAKLSAQLGVDVRPSRWGAYYDEVMTNAGALGFTDTTGACAPGHPRNGPANPPPCADPSRYYYYWGGHPSTAVHKLVGARLVEELD